MNKRRIRSIATAGALLYAGGMPTFLIDDCRPWIDEAGAIIDLHKPRLHWYDDGLCADGVWQDRCEIVIPDAPVGAAP